MTSSDIGMVVQKDPMVRNLDEKFTFQNCYDQRLSTRVAIKQQAVDDALKHIEAIVRKFRVGIAGVHEQERDAFNMMGGSEVSGWLEEIEQVKKKHEEFQILAGVVGATGAGKSSLLNAVLDFPDLLPSNEVEAGTATACRLAWNHNDSPDAAFRAEVIFRTKETVLDELEVVLLELKERSQLPRKKFDSAEDKVEFETELNESIDSGFQRIQAVWGIDAAEVQARKLTAEAILSSNPGILALLGAPKAIFAADMASFTDEIKPFLDSSKTGSSPQAARGGALWPLIQEVRVYLKAEVLRNGLVLVDLPGLSDAVQSRGAVAERFSRMLSITAIVAPAHRAADEKVGVALMGNLQQMRVGLEGGFQKNKYCVVLSKIDDMNCDAFIKSNEMASQDSELRAWGVKKQSLLAELDEILSRRREATKDLKTCRTELAKRRKESRPQLQVKQGPQASPDTDHLAASKTQYKKAKRAKHLAARQHQRMQAQLNQLENQKVHRSILIRSRYVNDRIQADFEKRVTSLSGREKHYRYDGSVDVLPASSKAYHEIRKQQKGMPGFQSVNFTGIPRLRQWLAEMTLEQREKHLDPVLRTLHRLFSRVASWSENQRKGLVVFRRKELEQALMATHETYRNDLTAMLHGACQDILKPEPLGSKKKNLAKCRARLANVTSQWIMEPSLEGDRRRKIPYATQAAILRRGGGFYQAKNGRVYNYLGTLARLLLDVVADGWQTQVSADLLAIINRAREGIRDLWRGYLDHLRSCITGMASPVIAYFDEASKNIDNIHEETWDRVQTALDEISGCDQLFPELVEEILHTQLSAKFEEAREITGDGCLYKRHEFICSKVEAASQKLFAEALTKMEKIFRSTVEKSRDKFDVAVSFGIGAVQQEITCLLNRLQVTDASTQQEALKKKEDLQNGARFNVIAWQDDWRRGYVDVQEEVLDIPQDCQDPDGAELAVTEEDDGDESGLDESDSAFEL